MLSKLCCPLGHPKHQYLEAGSRSPHSSSYLFHLLLHCLPYLLNGIRNSSLLQSIVTGHLYPDIRSLSDYTLGYIETYFKYKRLFLTRKA